MVGELYAVDIETLDALDELERCPTVYTRDTLHVTLHSSPADLIQCDAYRIRNYRQHLLTTETFITEYRDTQERRYVRPAAGDVLGIKEPYDSI